jgi:hypothetical protein
MPHPEIRTYPHLSAPIRQKTFFPHENPGQIRSTNGKILNSPTPSSSTSPLPSPSVDLKWRVALSLITPFPDALTLRRSTLHVPPITPSLTRNDSHYVAVKVVSAGADVKHGTTVSRPDEFDPAGVAGELAAFLHIFSVG